MVFFWDEMFKGMFCFFEWYFLGELSRKSEVINVSVINGYLLYIGVLFMIRDCIVFWRRRLYICLIVVFCVKY